MFDLSYNNDNLRSRLYIPVTAAGVGTISIYALIGGTDDVVFGMHPAITLGASIGAASFVADILHDEVLKKLAGNTNKEARQQFALLSPAMTGAGAVIAASVLMTGGIPNVNGAASLFAVGAGSEIISKYASDYIIAGETDDGEEEDY